MATRKVGFYHNGSKGSFQKHYAAFVTRLYELIGERDVEIVDMWGGGEQGLKPLSNQIAGLISQVDVIVAAGGPPSASAAKEATKGGSTPVVFMSVADPKGQLGLVNDLDHPGTNMTGIAGMTSELDLARLELLRELLADHGKVRIGVLNNAGRPYFEKQYDVLEQAQARLNVTLEPHDVVDWAGIESAFKAMSANKPAALLVTADSMFNNLRHKIVVKAEGIPAIYQWREFAEAGGLMSFGPNIIEAYQRVADYVALILDGESPADLPVSVPDRFEFVINLRAANKQGVKIPASMLSRAELVQTRLRVPHLKAGSYAK